MTPAQNVEAEEAVLGACMIDPDCLGVVRDVLQSEMFYVPGNRIVFAAMCSIQDRNEPVDQVTVFSELIKRSLLDKAGGTIRIAEMASAVGTAVNAPHHAVLIKDCATKRRVGLQAQSLLGRCEDPASDADDVMEDVSKLGVDFHVGGDPWDCGGLATEEAISRIERSLGDDPNQGRAWTGYRELDRTLAGLWPSDLIVIAARPSVGKTAFALEIAKHAAKTVTVGFISIEMSKMQLAMRQMCTLTGIDSQRVRLGEITVEELDRLARAGREISEWKLFLNDRENDIAKIVRDIRRLHRDKGVGLVVIDYLQLITIRAGRNDNRVQQIGAICKALKKCAKDLDIPIVTLAQLSRRSEERENSRPILSDLRDSGEIEQDADVVMGLYAPAMHGEDSEGIDNTHLLEVAILKQRNGPLNTVQLHYDRATGKIGSWTDIEVQDMRDAAGVSDSEVFG